MPESILLLNQTSLRILQLCDGNFSVAQITETLLAEYPEADLDLIENDVLQALIEFRMKGALTWKID